MKIKNTVKTWNIQIILPRDIEINMQFSEGEMAQQQYELIRSQGIYLGRWIDRITIKESL